MSNPLFTASQIATALDKVPKTVRNALEKVKPRGKVEVRGKSADAWTILQLPQPWICALDKVAAQHGCNAEQYLGGIRHVEDPAEAIIKPSRPIENIAGIAAILAAARHPVTLKRPNREAIWNLAMLRYQELLSEGLSVTEAGRIIRAALMRQVPQLTTSPAALAEIFRYKLVKGVMDRRRNNGNHFQPPQEDIDRLRHSAFHKNGGRMDSAWQEEYLLLSDYMQNRYPPSFTMPAAVRRLVNTEKTAALTDAEQGRRKLKTRLGSVKRDWSGMRSMHLWVMDDLTVNLEVSLVRDEMESIVQPQIVAVMDSPSRKFVGYAISPEKAPNAELVCAAMLNAVKTSKGVPKKLGLENGFVFGSALNVNGKVDDHGRTVVAGLARFGCSIHHFNKLSPQSKGELEKGFDLLLRHLERHPGYTGRNQLANAPDQFKREQRHIRSGKIEGTDTRYTYQEFCEVVAPAWFEKYNSTPRDCLNGRSPNEEFEQRWPHDNPPISFTPEMLWYLAKGRYRVPVKAGGVSFTHFGKQIRVRGEPLPEFMGRELWVLMEGANDELVSFLQLDFSNPFTLEICKETLPDELATTPKSDVLASEIRKIGQHMAAVRNERSRLIEGFGNTRHELLAEVRAQSLRPVEVSGPIAESAGMIQQQRSELREEKEQEATRQNKIIRTARNAGVHPAAVASAEKLAELMKGLNDD